MKLASVRYDCFVDDKSIQTTKWILFRQVLVKFCDYLQAVLHFLYRFICSFFFNQYNKYVFDKRFSLKWLPFWCHSITKPKETNQMFKMCFFSNVLSQLSSCFVFVNFISKALLKFECDSLLILGLKLS